MLRISKLTNYGTVLMAYLATHQGALQSANEIAKHTHIALPTVSKLLKLLARARLLTAQRGTKGGYRLAQPASAITLAQILHAMEGSELALTECIHNKGSCAMETLCAVRSNWRSINYVLHETLNKITLAQMAKPISRKQLVTII